MSDVGGDLPPDALLSRLGAELARAVPPAAESWTASHSTAVLDAWRKSGGVASDDLDRQLRAAARQAADELGEVLSELAAADVDRQRATPLQLVRAAMSGPTQVMQQAGVPLVVRDRFDEEHFPDDLYGLYPPSLQAMGEELGPLGLAWGAAKAAAHRARHSHVGDR